MPVSAEPRRIGKVHFSSGEQKSSIPLETQAPGVRPLFPSRIYVQKEWPREFGREGFRGSGDQQGATACVDKIYTADSGPKISSFI